MTTQLTPLFGMNINPAHEGVYRVKDYTCDGEYYSKWANGQWHLVRCSVKEATAETSRSHTCYNGDIVGWQGRTTRARRSRA